MLCLRHKFLKTIFIVSYYFSYHQSSAHTSVFKRDTTLSHLNEGDVCDKVDGVRWRCEPIIKCSHSYFSYLKGSEAKKCNVGVNQLYCCPPLKHVDGDEDPPNKPGLIFYTPTTTELPQRKPPPIITTTTTTTRRPTRRPVTKEPTNNSDVDNKIRRMRISERKCLEYSEAVFEKSSVLTLQIDVDDENEPDNRVDTCARQQIPLIVGGERAAAKEFPHQALLGYGENTNQVSWHCGAILISESYLLTAAHCTDVQGKGGPSVALLGEINYVSKSNNSTLVGIKQFFIHNDYVKNRPFNDIALLLTDKKVIFNGFIRPACIQTSPPVYPLLSPAKRVVASGWGLTENGGQVSPELLKVALDEIDRDTCNKAYSKRSNFIDNERVICAGDLNERKDICSGDSGGPLQVTLAKPYCMYSIVGVSAFGFRNGCGSLRPSAFTRVSFYQNWIESIVWPGQ